MKKNSIMIVALLATSSLTQSCAVGSFSALNTVYRLNTNMTNNKYVNAIVSFVIYPFETYVGGIIDLLILNTIEFWTGSNPLKPTQLVKNRQGHACTVAPTANGGYIITNMATDQIVNLIFEEATRTWSIDIDGVVSKLMTLVDKDNAIIYTIDGKCHHISLDEEGVENCRQLIQSQKVVTSDE